ncbi:hypothetical protein PVL29_011361 [Vitis rotundifolia]|uniref:Uncharacterized protein n=1 Tax=Vitis rotundifolia TaxID=103349 RepID=A0AA38ZNU1_VITRO|nr:hypothetical protein PVL29_011361 [Vitis rotundifolia]
MISHVRFALDISVNECKCFWELCFQITFHYICLKGNGLLLDLSYFLAQAHIVTMGPATIKAIFNKWLYFELVLDRVLTLKYPMLVGSAQVHQSYVQSLQPN